MTALRPELPPRPTGKPAEHCSIAGCLFPWRDEEPVLLQMPMSQHVYLPVFSDETRLRSLMIRAGVAFDEIKRIDEQDEFLVSLPPKIVVIKDPWFTVQGTVRFLQVLR